MPGVCAGQQQKPQLLFPAASADRVAEQALACVLLLLQRARPAPGEHTSSMLQRCAAVADLPPGSATEEVRPCGSRTGFLIWKLWVQLLCSQLGRSQVRDSGL